MYQALYRKYRSENFDHIAGQETVVNTLKNAIITKKISHAYLFSGPRGTGKTSIAKILAKTINCENLENDKICGKCNSCIQSLNNKNTDIVEIDAASNNGVDEIRELKNKINLVPTFGKYKVYIIDEVHMLTISAFNALLKTLEEPPAHVVFILATTEPHKIPSTIISRCQRFDFKRISDDSIVKRLKYICGKENILYDEESLCEIARLSDGGMRDAISILDQTESYSKDKITIDDVHIINGTVSKENLKNFFEKCFTDDLKGVLHEINEFFKKGKNLGKLTDEFILYLKNLLISKKIPDFFGEYEKKYYSLSCDYTIEKVTSLLDGLVEIIPIMKNSENPKLILEITFIKNIKKEESVEYTQTPVIKKNDETFIVEKNISQEIKKEKIMSNDMKNIRINNTLAMFDKKILIELKDKMKNVSDYLLDNKYSQVVSIILDGSLRAASSKNLIFMFKNKQDANYFNENIELEEELINKVLNYNDLKCIGVDFEEWETIKSEFNSKKKIYNYIEENNQRDLNKKNEIKKNSIENIFENIIECV